MCLISKDNNVQIAKEPIIAYKVMRFDYTSPCMGFDYSHYLENLDEVVYDVIPDPFFDYTRNKYVVEEGLHLFVDLRRAKAFSVETVRDLIFKCEIPIGAHFILGEYGEICTDQFKFIERI